MGHQSLPGRVRDRRLRALRRQIVDRPARPDIRGSWATVVAHPRPPRLAALRCEPAVGSQHCDVGSPCLTVFPTERSSSAWPLGRARPAPTFSWHRTHRGLNPRALRGAALTCREERSGLVLRCCACSRSAAPRSAGSSAQRRSCAGWGRCPSSRSRLRSSVTLGCASSSIRFNRNWSTPR